MQTELNILIVEDIPSDAEAMENELRNGAIRFHAKRVETKAAFLQELQRLYHQALRVPTLEKYNLYPITLDRTEGTATLLSG